MSLLLSVTVRDREKLYGQGRADPRSKAGPEKGRPLRDGGQRRLLGVRWREREREDHLCFALLTPAREGQDPRLSRMSVLVADYF